MRVVRAVFGVVGGVLLCACAAEPAANLPEHADAPPIAASATVTASVEVPASVSAAPAASATAEPLPAPSEQMGAAPLPSLPSSPVLGKPAPDFTLARVTTNLPITLTKLRGKVVVLFFFATFVAPAKVALEQYTELQKKNPGTVVVAISVDDPEAGGEVRSFAKSFPDITIVHDVEARVAMVYQPAKLPMTYVVDKGGVIRKVVDGFEANDKVVSGAVTELSKR